MIILFNFKIIFKLITLKYYPVCQKKSMCLADVFEENRCTGAGGWADSYVKSACMMA